MGTAIDRKTMASRISDSPTTTMPNGTSAALSWSETSIATAVCPVTRMSVTLSCCSHVDSCARRRWTRSAVCGSLCPHCGTIRTSPRSAVVLGVCLVTARTPGIAEMSLAIVCTVPLGSVLVMMFAVTSSGLLYPGPNSLAIRS